MIEKVNEGIRSYFRFGIINDESTKNMAKKERGEERREKMYKSEEIIGSIK